MWGAGSFTTIRSRVPMRLTSQWWLRRRISLRWRHCLKPRKRWKTTNWRNRKSRIASSNAFSRWREWSQLLLISQQKQGLKNDARGLRRRWPRFTAMTGVMHLVRRVLRRFFAYQWRIRSSTRCHSRLFTRSIISQINNFKALSMNRLTGTNCTSYRECQCKTGGWQTKRIYNFRATASR